MENFIVSARKYRPSTFNTVVGQSSITNTLKNAIRNNHLAQAFLFCGPRGVGKTTCARILAKTINCFNIDENTEACNECESCISFNVGHSLNIYELDAASNNSVDDIRNLVEQVRFAPQIGKFKIYIIDEVHMLSAAAFNAFLKTLEEPPPYAIFILATTERHKIIPTILSRCQIFDFQRIRIADITEHLKYIAKSENITADPEGLHIIAQKADGALRDALSMFDQLVSFAGNNLTYKAVVDNLNILDSDYYFKVTDSILKEDIPSSLLLFNEILNKGFDGNNFINGLGEHFRNLLVCKDTATLQLLEVSENTKERYKTQAQSCDTLTLLSGLNIINKCDVQYKMSRNQRLSVEFALMQLCSIASNKKDQDRTSMQRFISNVIIQAPKGKTKENVTPASIEKQVTQNEKIAKKNPREESSVVDLTQPSTKSKAKPGLHTISINSLKTSGAENKKENQSAEPTAPVLSTAFSKEDMLHYWNLYAEKIKGTKMNLYATLTKNTPTLRENGTIELTIDNSVQREELKIEKADLLLFLRKELRNDTIDVIPVMSTIETQSRAYTPNDKFKKMVEKNPLLNKLKQQLDLEID